MAILSRTSGQIDVCDVCALVDHDESPKEINYCERCGANICAECESNLPRRAQAWGLRKMKGLPRREAA